MNEVVPRGRVVRVAHVIHGLQLGGLEQLVVRLSSSARSEGIESIVLAFGEDGPVRNLLASANVPLVWLAGVKGLSPQALSRIAQEADAFGAEVLHGHDLGPWLNAVAARALVPSAVAMATFHEVRPVGSKFAVLAKLAATFSGAVVACGDEVRNTIAAWAPRGARLRTINNGVPIPPPRTSEDRQRARERLGLPGDARVFGYLGRLHREKGTDLLLAAFQQQFRSDERAHLVVIGGGALEQELRAEAEPACRDRIHFTGEVPDGSSLLAALDVYVQPSRREGRSLSMIEAMAASLPTIAHAIPAVREFHGDGETALLVPFEDVGALAAAMGKLAHDEVLAVRLGRNAREKSLSHSLEAMTTEYAQLYRDLVTRARA